MPLDPPHLSRDRLRRSAETIDLNQPGYLRLKAVLAVYPVSRAAWYQGIKDGIYPKGVPLSRRSVGWPTEAIKALIDSPPFANAD